MTGVLAPHIQDTDSLPDLEDSDMEIDEEDLEYVRARTVRV